MGRIVCGTRDESAQAEVDLRGDKGSVHQVCVDGVDAGGVDVEPWVGKGDRVLRRPACPCDVFHGYLGAQINPSLPAG